MFLIEIIENNSLVMFLSIVIPIACVVGGYFVYRSVLRERKRYREEVANYIEGILNKREISTSISSYITRSEDAVFSLIAFDLDKFTTIIENFGREEADNIIKDLAYKIMEILPKRVEIGRTDVDEFLIFVKGEYDRDAVMAMAKKLLLLTNEPMKIFDDSTINLTASISICYYPLHGNNLKDLQESLDIAMYIIKRDGGNQIKVYNKKFGEVESGNMQYYKQIKDGIKNSEFTLYYQPMINCETKKIFGVEGLLRWNHPELGVLSPFKFINIMEQSGDIKWVGEWGLECLIKEYIELKKISNGDSLIVSLNLSPKQLSDPMLPVEFQKLVKKYRINPKDITLEIAEFTIYDKHDVIKKNITDLKDLGFSIAVDGFGLDFNGIKRLEELKIDIVKLDKEYLDPETDAQLKQKFLGLLIDFAKQNNITIVAEGIEDIQALQVALGLGVQIVQGYNFAKPMSAEELTKYVESNDWLTHM